MTAIPGNYWVPVLDEAWLASPTMMAALRRRAEIDALSASHAVVLPGPERLVRRTVLDVPHLVYPVAREVRP